MSENEIKLLKIIRESDDPARALVIAMSLITECLQEPEAFEERAIAYLQGLDETP